MPTKILAIDDSKTMRLAVKITFAAEDADVTSVSKGSDAVDRAKQLSPDVILVDAALGEGEPSGYEVCESLKAEDDTKDTPVILMVSNQTGVDQAKFDASGAVAFIKKPFDSQELIDKVTEATGGEVKPAIGSRPSVSKPAVPKPAAAKPAVPKPAVPKAPVPRPAAPKPAVAKPAVAKPAVPKPAVSKPAVPKPSPRPAARPSAAASGGPIPIAVPIPFTPADSPTSGMLERISKAAGEGGIDPKVAEAIAALSREVIESVVWEVVPELAEEIIKKQAQKSA